MTPRLYDRLAAIASILFLLVLGAATYYLAVWANRPGGTAIQTHSNVPDMFVEGVALTRLDHLGEPVFRMSADSMMHFPIDGSSEFRNPLLVSLDPTRPRLTVRALTATANQDASATVLTGDVILERQADANDPTLVVRTERLVISADSETARTDLPVRITHGPTRLTGVGMDFDNIERTFRLAAQVRGEWPDATESAPDGPDDTPAGSEDRPSPALPMPTSSSADRAGVSSRAP